MRNFTLLNSTEEELTFQWNKIQISTIKIPKDDSGNVLKGLDLISFLNYLVYEQQDMSLIIPEQDFFVQKKFGLDDLSEISYLPVEISDEIGVQKTPEEIIKELEEKNSKNSKNS